LHQHEKKLETLPFFSNAKIQSLRHSKVMGSSRRLLNAPSRADGIPEREHLLFVILRQNTSVP
jgi:hypothetical protein